jgi:hypothetical protein
MATQGIAIASTIWWGSGVVVAGNLGGAIMTAIGQAVALHCLTNEKPRSNFETVKVITECRAAQPIEASSPAGLRALKLSGELGLAIYASMTKDRSAIRTIREMTHEFWGREVAPTVILDRLRQVGIEPPNGLHGLSEAYDG